MKLSIKIIVSVAASLAFAVITVLLLAQPLITTRDYTVVATHNGEPMSTELFHLPFIKDIYFVHLPDSLSGRYHWFGVFFPGPTVSWPVAVYTGIFGIRYMHTDQLGGIRITDAKMEDHWSIDPISNGVNFFNSSISVTLTRNP